MLTFLVAAAMLDLPRLQIKDQSFVDPSGSVVQLRGVNLGGWLVEEIWMTPVVGDPPAGSGFSKVADHYSLWGTIEKRLGAPSMERLRTAWRENWIQESDFKRIRDLGLNHIR